MANKSIAKSLLVFFLLFPACSTPPKNPGDVYELRRRAETLLEQGNRQADRGGLDSALTLLDEAMRIAVSADDPGLIVRAGLSRSNVFFLSGRRDEAAAGLDSALVEAERTGNSELAAVCRIHIARGKLYSADGAGIKAAAESARGEVSKNLPFIKTDRLYTAFAWTVLGLAEKELGSYGEAEASARRSLEIHEKDRYFELAAYDWFMIASYRSLSGNYGGARQALEAAVGFDRRVENSWGLASD
ncbi:MAG: hypothetical protein FWH38_07580, partial [Treponema sp.]|nr:hypothetical protein [Treponema sp.]